MEKVIIAKNLSKIYIKGQFNFDSLKGLIHSKFRRAEKSSEENSYTALDNISFEVGNTPGKDMDPVCFSADKLREVLIANRGDVGQLHVSPDGLARIDFVGTDFESSYWLVMLQN